MESIVSIETRTECHSNNLEFQLFNLRWMKKSITKCLCLSINVAILVLLLWQALQHHYKLHTWILSLNVHELANRRGDLLLHFVSRASLYEKGLFVCDKVRFVDITTRAHNLDLFLDIWEEALQNWK